MGIFSFSLTFVTTPDEVNGISISEPLMEKFGNIVRVMRNTFFKRSAALLLASTILFTNANLCGDFSWAFNGMGLGSIGGDPLDEIQHIGGHASCRRSTHDHGFHVMSKYTSLCKVRIWETYYWDKCNILIAYNKCKDEAWDACMANVPSEVTNPGAGVGGFIGTAVGAATGGVFTGGNPYAIGAGAIIGIGAGTYVGTAAAENAYCMVNATYQNEKALCHATYFLNLLSYRNALRSALQVTTTDNDGSGVCDTCEYIESLEELIRLFLEQ